MTTYNEEITEALDAADTGEAAGSFAHSIDESLDIADNHIIGWLTSINEALAISDDTAIGWLQELIEAIFIYEEVKNSWAVTNTEDLTLTDSLSEVMGLVISDWITLVDSQTNNWNGQEIVPDSLTLYDISKMAQMFSDSLTDTINIADVSTLALTVAVLESLGFADLANAVRSASESINDSVVFADSPAHALSLLVNDTLDAVDVSSVIASFIHSVDESIGLDDAASLIKRISDTVTDPLTFAETLSSKGTLYSAVYDAIALNVVVELAGDIYECYVLNTPKFMPSMYSGFDFNSFCVFENRAFGANDLGVYELTGTTDAGSIIHTGAILNETDFGVPNQKRFRRGYLGISGTTPVMVFETEDGTRQTYSIDTKGKVVASHELKSKKWILSVADFDTLEGIKLIPVILTK